MRCRVPTRAQFQPRHDTNQSNHTACHGSGFRAPLSLDWHASFAWVTDRETQQRVLQLPSQLKMDMLSGESCEGAISPCIYKNGSPEARNETTCHLLHRDELLQGAIGQSTRGGDCALPSFQLWVGRTALS
ncbi:hypothetical protein J3F84DRAFT_366175 [Trichoderma pleuroticola]